MYRLSCLLTTAILFASCSNNTHENTQQNNTVVAKQLVAVNAELPFIGKRGFETRPGIAGTGTPSWMVEIKADGIVEFSFVQINQADKETTTTGLYKAGPFKKIMKCVFKEWYNETRYYEITKDMVYQTDSVGTRLKSDECCGLTNYELGENCPCEGELYEQEK